MELQQIESGLAAIKGALDTLESTIERKKQRMAEMKELLDEAKKLKSDIGKLKKERSMAKARLEWLVEFFKSINNGQFPDGMYPLFMSEEKAL